MTDANDDDDDESVIIDDSHIILDMGRAVYMGSRE